MIRWLELAFCKIILVQRYTIEVTGVKVCSGCSWYNGDATGAVVEHQEVIVMEKMEKKFFKVKEIVELLGISKSMVYEYVYRNKIPAKRLGRRILIPEKFVRELMLPEK